MGSRTSRPHAARLSAHRGGRDARAPRLRCSKSASLIQIGFEYDCVLGQRTAWSRRLGLNAKREDGLLRYGYRWGAERFRWMGSEMVS
jgi:hypothetical protein